VKPYKLAFEVAHTGGKNSMVLYRLAEAALLP